MADLEIYTGTDAALDIECFMPDGETAYDLTGCSLTWEANDGTNSISKSTAAGTITLDTPLTLGTGAVNLVPSDTSSWEGEIRLPWRLNLTTAAGKVYVVNRGHLRVSQHIRT